MVRPTAAHGRGREAWKKVASFFENGIPRNTSNRTCGAVGEIPSRGESLEFRRQLAAILNVEDSSGLAMLCEKQKPRAYGDRRGKDPEELSGKRRTRRDAVTLAVANWRNRTHDRNDSHGVVSSRIRSRRRRTEIEH